MEEEKRTFFSRLKPILKQPWFFLIALELLYIFCFVPLLKHPEVLSPFLSKNLFDRWLEFAVWNLEDILSIGFFITLLLSFCLCVILFYLCIVFFRRRNFKKAIEHFLLILLLLFFCSPPRLNGKVISEKSKRLKCQANLKMLYLAMASYEEENGGLLPDLKTFEASQTFTPRDLRCPTRLENSTPEYKYYGKGRNLNEKPSFLLMEEVGGNHIGEYRNRLYSDGSIKH